MRHWLLILMIALLPLRGWASDAMALSMWATPASPHQTAAPCHGAPADTVSLQTMAGSGHVHAGQAMAHGGDDADASAHGGCTACDICNVPAISPVTHIDRATVPLHTHRVSDGEHFASAVPQRGSKPPIA
jgi:hypothetical protein